MAAIYPKFYIKISLLLFKVNKKYKIWKYCTFQDFNFSSFKIFVKTREKEPAEVEKNIAPIFDLQILFYKKCWWMSSSCTTLANENFWATLILILVYSCLWKKMKTKIHPLKSSNNVPSDHFSSRSSSF